LLYLKIDDMHPIGSDKVKSEKTISNLSLPVKLTSQFDGLVAIVKTVQRVSAGIALADKISESRSIKSPADFGLMVKNVRKSQRLSQQQFADLVGVGRRFVSECEAGKPRLEFAKVLQVAAAAGIDIFAIKR
jgi:y4mF family transcriptional regulator